MFPSEVIGRLHLVIIHLPIGILLFAFAMILLERFRRVDIQAGISFALLWGSISAVAACIAGWNLAHSGEYDADLVFRHQWTGIATAGLGFSAYFVKRIRDILTTLTVVFLAVAGHYGGTLTHGEGYLFPKKKTPREASASTISIAHSLGTPKVDNPQNSTNQQVTVISTPKNSSKNTQTETSKNVSQTTTLDSTKKAAFMPLTSAVVNEPQTEATILTIKTEAATPSVLNKLKQENIIISTFGEGSNYLMANFVNVKNYNSALIDDLSNIEHQLVRVRLSNQPVSDADVKKLSALKNLTRLNLEKTTVTDAALVHLKNLPNLEQLNLYGTGITDKGLTALAKCPHLKVVYLWQTNTTPLGIEQLKKALPNVHIDTGGFQFVKPDTNNVKNENIKGR